MGRQSPAIPTHLVLYATHHRETNPLPPRSAFTVTNRLVDEDFPGQGFREQTKSLETGLPVSGPNDSLPIAANVVAAIGTKAFRSYPQVV
jgi:hypothetical protein